MHYRPLPEYLTIAESKWLSEITGKRQTGLFAIEDIEVETNMGISHIKDTRFENDLIRTPLGGFFNHNGFDPNCYVRKCEMYMDNEVYSLISLRDIKAGEELTARYTLYDPSTTSRD